MDISQEIIKKSIQGNSKAQKQLVVQSAPSLMRVALRYTHDRPTAEDVLQDSYITIFKKLGSYNREIASMESWMRKITIYTAIAKYRKKSWTHEVAIDHGIENNNGVFDSSRIELNQLYKLIDSLPDGYRTVFNLKVIEGFSHKEIATLLNISPSTSRSQLKRARNILQEKVKKLENIYYEF